jgi:hypothetical protein
MRSAVRNRFTIYDAMEAKGVFSSNPANADSYDPAEGVSIYSGPVQYPKMLYHPKGKERVLIAAEVVVNPTTGEALLDREGKPIMRGEQREIIWELAQSEEEEERLRSAGWHDHPAKAMKAAGKEAPSMGSGEKVKDLEAENRLLREKLAALEAPQIQLSSKRS